MGDDQLISMNDQLKGSILVVLVAGYILYEQKPGYFFKDNGDFKGFGLKQDETPFPFFMILMIVGFTTYYGLLLKEGKYV